MHAEAKEPREPLTVTIRPALKQELMARADADGRSASNYLERLLECRFAAERDGHGTEREQHVG